MKNITVLFLFVPLICIGHIEEDIINDSILNNRPIFKTKKGLNLFPEDRIEYSIASKSFFSNPFPLDKYDLSSLLTSSWEFSNSNFNFFKAFPHY